MSKTILAEIDGFTPMPDLLIKRYGLITAAVFGHIWRFCQMKDGVCRAGIERIAGELNISRMTVIRHIETLVNDGFLKDTTPTLRNRPHIYADTGKVSMYNKWGMSAGVSESDSETSFTVSQSDSTIPESDPHYTTELLEDTSKKQVKKQERAKIQIPGIEASIRQGRPTTQKDIDATNATWAGREKIPEPIRELLDVYVELTCQRPTKGQLIDWLQTGQEWLELGIIPIDLKAAYSKAKPDNGDGFMVARPGSLTRVAGMVAGERRKNTAAVIAPQGKVESVYFDPSKPFYKQKEPA